MKKTLLLLLIFSACLQLVAQKTINLKVGNEFGYAWNLYSSPDSYLMNNDSLLGRAETTKDAWTNHSVLNFSYKQKFKRKHALEVFTKNHYNVFLNNNKANDYSLGGGLKYAYSNLKWFKFEFGADAFKRRNLTINLVTDDQVSAYDYWKVGGEFNLKFRLAKYFYLTLENKSGYKDYLPLLSGNIFTHYYQNHELGLKYRFKKLHYFNVKASWSANRFNDLYYSDEDPQKVTWNYYRLFGEYKFKKSSKKYLALAYRYTSKQDHSQGNFAFFQHDVIGRFSWEVKQWLFQFSTHYGYREYLKREAYIDDEQIRLRYHYIGGQARIGYEPVSGLLIYAEGNVLNRFSNSTMENRKGRRSFLRGTMLLGISYQLKKKMK